MNKRESGLEPADKTLWEVGCSHVEHSPPQFIYIPRGMQYRHICPACDNEVLVREDGEVLTITPRYFPGV